MTRKITSPRRLDNLLAVSLVALILCIATTQAAPLQDATEVQQIADGCYYNYNSYNEGDRILTNEPCLNCTCHNSMLMCYLRVCPFTKPIGHDCIVEKREDQCCPIVTCPEVPVDVPQHVPEPGTELSFPEKFGCSIENKFYLEGAQVPSNPNKPCELCYCIKNRTSCLIQECTLHIDGCTPIYNKGSCCPVRYNCDHENDVLELEDHSTTTAASTSSSTTTTTTTTTERPSEGFILTTTMIPSVSTDCIHNSELYADGASLTSENPCEHCYCMRGKIVCAVQECEMPMLSGNGHCQAVPAAAGECCPSKYKCEDENLTTLSADETTLSMVDDQVPTTASPVKDLHGAIPEEDLQLQTHIDDIEDKKDGESELSTDAPISDVDQSTDADTGSGDFEDKLTTVAPSSSESEASTEASKDDTEAIKTDKEKQPEQEAEEQTAVPDKEEVFDEITTSSPGLDDRIDLSAPQKPIQKGDESELISNKPEIEEDIEKSTTKPEIENEEDVEKSTTKPEIENEEDIEKSTTKPDERIDISATQQPAQKGEEQLVTAKPEIEKEEDVDRSTTKPEIESEADIKVVDMQQESGEVEDVHSTAIPHTESVTTSPSDLDKEMEITSKPHLSLTTSKSDELDEEEDVTTQGPKADNASDATDKTDSDDIHKTVPSATTVHSELENTMDSTTDKQPDHTDENITPSVDTDKTSSPSSTSAPLAEFTTTKADEEESTTPKVSDILPKETLDTQTAPPMGQIPDEGTPVDVQFPALIPGEGDCLVNKNTYINNSMVPTSDDCEISCKCVSSVVVCKHVDCEIPQVLTNCVFDEARTTKCCPAYNCATDETPLASIDESLSHVKDEQPEEDRHETTDSSLEITTMPSTYEISDEKSQVDSSTVVPLAEKTGYSTLGPDTLTSHIQSIEPLDKQKEPTVVPSVEDADEMKTTVVPLVHKPTEEDEIEMGSGEENEHVEHSTAAFIPKKEVKPIDVEKVDSAESTTIAGTDNIEAVTEKDKSQEVDLAPVTTASPIDLDIRISEGETDIKPQGTTKPTSLEGSTVRPYEEVIPSKSDEDESDKKPSLEPFPAQEPEHGMESTTSSDDSGKTQEVTTVASSDDITQIPTEKDIPSSTDSPKLSPVPQETVDESDKTKEPSPEGTSTSVSPAAVDELPQTTTSDKADHEATESSTIHISSSVAVDLDADSTTTKSIEDKDEHLPTTIAPTDETTDKALPDDHTDISTEKNDSEESVEEDIIHTSAPLSEKEPIDSDLTTPASSDDHTARPALTEEATGQDNKASELYPTTITPIDKVVEKEDEKDAQPPTSGVSDRVDEDSSYETVTPPMIEQEQKKPVQEVLSHTLDKTTDEDESLSEIASPSPVDDVKQELEKQSTTVQPLIKESSTQIHEEKLTTQTEKSELSSTQKPYETSASLEPNTDGESGESEEEEVQTVHDIVEVDTITTVKPVSSIDEVGEPLNVTENVLDSDEKESSEKDKETDGVTQTSIDSSSDTDKEGHKTEAPETSVKAEIPVIDKKSDKDNTDKITTAPEADTEITTPTSYITVEDLDKTKVEEVTEVALDDKVHRDSDFEDQTTQSSKDQNIQHLAEKATEGPADEAIASTPSPELSASESDDKIHKDSDLAEKATETPVDDSELVTPSSDLSAPQSDDKTHRDTTDVPTEESDNTTPYLDQTAEKITKTPVEVYEVTTDSDLAEKSTEAPIKDISSAVGVEGTTNKPDNTAFGIDDKIDKDSDFSVKATEAPVDDLESATSTSDLSAPELDDKIHKDSDLPEKTTQSPVEDSSITTSHPELSTPESNDEIQKGSALADKATETPVDATEFATPSSDLSAPESDEKVNKDSDLPEKTTEATVEDLELTTPSSDLSSDESDDKDSAHQPTDATLEGSRITTSLPELSASESDQKIQKDSDLSKPTHAPVDNAESTTPHTELSAPESDDKSHKEIYSATESTVEEITSAVDVEITTPRSDQTVFGLDQKIDTNVVYETTKAPVEDSDITTAHPALSGSESDQILHKDSDIVDKATEAPEDGSELTAPSSDLTTPDVDDKIHKDGDVVEKATEASVEDLTSAVDIEITTPKSDQTVLGLDQKIVTDVVYETAKAPVEDSDITTPYPALSGPESDQILHKDSDIVDKATEAPEDGSELAAPSSDLTTPESDDQIHKDNDIVLKATEAPVDELTSAVDVEVTTAKSDQTAFGLDQKIDTDVVYETTKAPVEDSDITTPYPGSDLAENITKAPLEDSEVTFAPSLSGTDTDKVEKSTEGPADESVITTSSPESNDKLHKDSDLADKSTEEPVVDSEYATPSSDLSAPVTDENIHEDSDSSDKSTEGPADGSDAADQNIHKETDIADKITPVDDSAVSTPYPELAAPESEPSTEKSIEDSSHIGSEQITPASLDMTHKDESSTLDSAMTTLKPTLDEGAQTEKTVADEEESTSEHITPESLDMTHKDESPALDSGMTTLKPTLDQTTQTEKTVTAEEETTSKSDLTYADADKKDHHYTTSSELEVTTIKSDLSIPESEDHSHKDIGEEQLITDASEEPLSTDTQGTTQKSTEMHHETADKSEVTEEPYRSTISPLDSAAEGKPSDGTFDEKPLPVAEPDEIEEGISITTTTHPLFPQHLITTISPGFVDRIDLANKTAPSSVTPPTRTETTTPKIEIPVTTAANYPQPQPPVYGQPPQYPSYPEDEYGDEEETEVFGPGTCRYGGKLYVSAQQIPRDDPCDFCFCFRSDIICLQQSCPPPISGCHEEPISGFCCPRYECPVSMATVLNITTSTTTTSTTLPPHFLHHSYGGAVQRNGCQINGRSYRVGDRIDSTSGPCINCTCGGDGKMKCDPQTCLPDPTMQQVMAVVAASKQR